MKFEAMVSRESGDVRRATARSARTPWAVAAVPLGFLVATAPATTIDWVQWSSGGTGSNVINGTGSGLTVTGTFTSEPTGFNFWRPRATNISDAAWPYSNTNVEYWEIAQSGSDYIATATFDFSNTGGLAAGGSIALIDVENPGSSIQVEGYRWNGSSYDLVAVDWADNTYTLNPASSQAIWNASTNTLTGAGGQVGGVDTFSMLTSNEQLDRIVLSFDVAGDDGIGIAFTSSNIDAAANPVPGAGLAGLATAGLAGTTRRRRR